MDSKEKISVIIPNYNYGRFIRDAIESVLSQTYQPIEIIVVDDGSTDDSVKVVETFGGKIKLIKQQNGGVGKARNTGAKNSTGDFLAFLDADDIWFPEKLEKQIVLFSNESVGYVSCGMREFNTEGKTIDHHIPLLKGWTTKNMLLFDAPTAASGSAFIVKKEIFEKVGGFDENPELHPSEDWDFARRVSEVCSINPTADILVDYRNHGDNGHLDIPRFERSMTLAFEKTFKNASPTFQKVKNQAYGNLHRIFAGSYFQAGDYKQFIKHSLYSFRKSPKNILYFVQYFFR